MTGKLVCATPLRGYINGQLATGTAAGYVRHRRAGEQACLACLRAASSKARAWARANPEAQRRSEALWRKSNPEKIRAKYLRTWNITQEDFARRLTEQNGRCAICQTNNPGPSGFNIDHDHACCSHKGSCGKCIRALLCSVCNFRLGIIEDRIFLEAALRYLESYR